VKRCGRGERETFDGHSHGRADARDGRFLPQTRVIRGKESGGTSTHIPDHRGHRVRALGGSRAMSSPRAWTRMSPSPYAVRRLLQIIAGLLSSGLAAQVTSTQAAQERDEQGAFDLDRALEFVEGRGVRDPEEHGAHLSQNRARRCAKISARAIANGDSAALALSAQPAEGLDEHARRRRGVRCRRRCSKTWARKAIMTGVGEVQRSARAGKPDVSRDALVQFLQRGGHVRILLADDDDVRNAFRLEALLRKRGYDVISVDDGDAAWKVLQQVGGRPPLAILDWVHAGHQRARALPQGARAPGAVPYVYVIMLTAKRREERHSWRAWTPAPTTT